MSKSIQKYEGFKCPDCGTDMKRDAATGKLSCPTCGHLENACHEDSDNVKFDFAAAENDPALQDWGVPVQTVNCQSCGGKMVVTAMEGASSCAFCASQHVIALDDRPGIRPDSIIPFKIDETKAKEHVSEWIQKRYLAPFSFKSEYASGQLIGVYQPYWSFDAQVNAGYTGQVANSYMDTEIDTVTNDERTETKKRKVKKLRWRFVTGTLDKKFKNVMFSDTMQLDIKIIEKLEPYKLNELINFSPKYLAGYAAGCCKSGLAAAWKRAQDYMGKTVRHEVRDIVRRGADALGTVNTCAEYNEISYKQLLLPAWIGTYRYKKKNYHIYINGQTGVMFGESPKSVLKIGIIAFAVLAVIAAVIFLL